MKYLVAAIEYFTKWIEAELVAQITAHKVQHFVWRNIVCRFGVPRCLVSDNGTQFASQQLGKLCTKVRIKQVFVLVEHPQTNGQVESANRVLLRGLKRRLEKAKGTWAEEVMEEAQGHDRKSPSPSPNTSSSFNSSPTNRRYGQTKHHWMSFFCNYF